jgi:putative DNA primase/helicase
MPLVDRAHRLLHEYGFHPFPGDHPDYPDCIGAHGPTSPCDGERGKHPCVKWKTYAVTVTPQMITSAWEARKGLANILIACGPSSLVVLDEDQAGELDRWATDNGFILTPTYTVKTNRGEHRYYFWDHAIRRISNSDRALKGKGYKVDVRGDGGYAVGEGSRHASGIDYIGNGLPVAPLPDEAAALLLAGAADANKPRTESSPWDQTNNDFNNDRIAFGNRHRALIAYAGRLRGLGLDYLEALPVYRQRWLLCEQPEGQYPESRFHHPGCESPVTLEEATAKLQSVYFLYEAGRPAGGAETAAPAVTHSGQVRFAYLLATAFKDRLLYVHGIGWHHWDGTRWALDETGHAQRAALAMLQKALAESIRDKELRRDVQRCESAAGIAGILAIASALPEFAVTVRDMDADPYLLNHAGGTLDLRTMKDHRHKPDDRLTKISRGAYRPDTESVLWTTFLAKILPNAEVRECLQRFVGVSLVGAVLEQKLFVGVGIGANGKTVFDCAIRSALGDHAIVAEPDLLLMRENQHPTGLMDLRGVRWASISENDRDRHLAEAALKRLVGGDTIKARFMRQDFVQWTPSHSAMLFTNFLPRASGDDPAIWRRIRVIPYGVVIPEAERDPQLGMRLEFEADGIITWAVRGFEQYVVRNGLAEPKDVLVATDNYQKSSDAVARFVDECCTTGELMKVTTAVLYTKWERWCTDEGADQMSAKAFGQSLDRLGYPVTSRTSAGRWRHGIALKVTEGNDV